ncbi:MAG TPA: lysylphosphatidylglycerol synthetase family protein, partial [Acetobacteraceae bacterium]|nr:lysylphosphatidylglycerol synthetase family protein [Acetobacteraceae bacterium]
MTPVRAERLKTILRHAPAVLGVGLLIGAVFVVQREFHNLRVAEIQRALHEIPQRSLFIAFGWTLAAYGVLTFYDRLGTYYAGKAVSY